MKIEYADTEKIQEISFKIKNLVSEYNEVINSLFTRINNMNDVTLEWTGTQADRYVEQVMLEKESYINFGNKLDEFANMISNNATEIDNTSNDNQRIEDNIVW